MLGCDLAVSERTDADHTVFAKIGLSEDGNLVLTNITRMQAAWPHVRIKLLQEAIRNGPGVEIAISQTSTQKGFVQDIQRADDFARFTVHPVTEVGSKLVRANRWISRINAGKFYIIRSGWNDTFISECAEFTGHEDPEDDQIDAISIAYEILAPAVGDYCPPDEDEDTHEPDAQNDQQLAETTKSWPERKKSLDNPNGFRYGRLGFYGNSGRLDAVLPQKQRRKRRLLGV
jgi:predicted phage terminase large subunit-like protein